MMEHRRQIEPKPRCRLSSGRSRAVLSSALSLSSLARLPSLPFTLSYLTVFAIISLSIVPTFAGNFIWFYVRALLNWPILSSTLWQFVANQTSNRSFSLELGELLLFTYCRAALFCSMIQDAPNCISLPVQVCAAVPFSYVYGLFIVAKTCRNSANSRLSFLLPWQAYNLTSTYSQRPLWDGTAFGRLCGAADALFTSLFMSNCSVRTECAIRFICSSDLCSRKVPGCSLRLTVQWDTCISRFNLQALSFAYSFLIDSLSSSPVVSSGDCSSGTLTFELITGHVYTSPADTVTMLPGVLHLSECLEHCRSNQSCNSLNFETGLCVLLSSSALQRPFALTPSQFPVFTLYAHKVCLTGRCHISPGPIIGS